MACVGVYVVFNRFCAGQAVSSCGRPQVLCAASTESFKAASATCI